MAKETKKETAEKRKKATASKPVVKETTVTKKAPSKTSVKKKNANLEVTSSSKVVKKDIIKEEKKESTLKSSASKKTISEKKKATSDKSIKEVVLKEKKVAAPKKQKNTTSKKVELPNSEKKAVKSTKKAVLKKVSPKIEKKSTTKKTEKKVEKKSSKANKATRSLKAVSKKTPTKRKSPSKKVSQNTAIEYYDLPYRYNETVVKLLAQTPTVLFVYWDISDTDRENFTNTFGNDFFNKTKPVLVIHNETKNYSFEIDIDDFANCWYIHVDDSSSKYKIELGRRAKVENYYIPNNYLYITSSNIMETPNDRILFDNNSMVYFRNVKTGDISSKNIATLSFMRNMGRLYNIYDLYKKIYKDELDNPSSRSNPSSGTFIF